MSRWRAIEKLAVAITIGTAAVSGAAWVGAHSRSTARPTVVTEIAAPSTNQATATTIVFDIDVTASVTAAFIREAQRSFAQAVIRIVHDGQGPIRIYVREISHTSGSDAAAVGTYTIRAVPTCGNNPFDLRCRRAHVAALATAHKQARAIAARIEHLELRRTSAGTALRGAFAAGGELLVDADGKRWLVAATDLRPSNAPPSTEAIDLQGVNVVILYACEQAIAQCQSRQAYWDTEFRRDGATLVTFLTTQQSDLIFASRGR